MKKFLIIFLFLNINFLSAEIFLKCNNPERSDLKEDIYLLKIYDEFEEKGIYPKGRVDIKRLVKTKKPKEIGITERKNIEILKEQYKYSIFLKRQWNQFEDFWQINRSDLKLEITRRKPYKEFNGKCKILTAEQFSSLIGKNRLEQNKLKSKRENNRKI